MGSSAQGLARTVLMSALALLWAVPVFAQVPGPAAQPANPGPAQPVPQAPPPLPPPAAPPAAGPLQPAPAPQPTQRPGFLHTREEMERINRAPQPWRPRPAPEHKKADFFARATPWVDFGLTSFYLEDRVDNVLNFGMQAGAYFFEHLRVSGRLVTPLEAVGDSYNRYDTSFSGTDSTHAIKSRNISLLYGFSAGLVMSNGKAFAFGPSVALLRTDVEAYGTAWFVTLPFEWTTQRNLRIGFELGLGHAFGGKQRQACRSCGVTTVDRPGGTSLLGQFNIGYALGSL